MTVPAPKHYWNFNETSGTTAADAVGGAVIALDRASWVPGRVGNAIRFNRKDGAKLATTSLPEVPPPWTVTFWVMREEDCDGAAIFSSPHYGLKLEQWENTHQVGFTKYSTSTIQGFDPSFDYTAPLKQWVHLALVMGTDNKLRRYVNGKGNDFREVQEPLNLGLRWLGSTHGYTEFASAIFDEIKVFDQALTDEQVRELAGVILLKNGSFEEGIVALNIPPGSNAIPGWTVTQGNVDCINTSTWQAADGSQSIDLNGFTAGGIEQTFETLPGTLYTVEFSLAGNPYGAVVKKMRVEVTPSTSPQSQDFSFDISGHSGTSMGWERKSWQFTAQATSTTIKFSSLIDGAYGPVIDNVVVLPASPK